MANLLPTVDIFQHRNSRLRYTNGKQKGKETTFLYYTQRLFLANL